MSGQGSGLRISTAKGKPGVSRDSLDEQPGSEAFYSPSASHDASPASEPPALNPPWMSCLVVITMCCAHAGTVLSSCFAMLCMLLTCPACLQAHHTIPQIMLMPKSSCREIHPAKRHIKHRTQPSQAPSLPPGGVQVGVPGGVSSRTPARPSPHLKKLLRAQTMTHLPRPECLLSSGP